MKKKTAINLIFFIVFSLFVGLSLIVGFQPGVDMGRGSWSFIKTMLLMFPGAFILIGLFDSWVDRTVIERTLGERSGFGAYFWMMLLAFTVMAPLLVALPIAKSLLDKGAKRTLVIAFLGFSTVCRIPMTVFEASYLGLAFSAVRFVVSLPLVILFAEILGRWFSTTEFPDSLPLQKS